MKELIISVPEDAVEFVEEFVERIGGNVENIKRTKSQSSQKESKKSRPLDFFGTWKDIPLDPKTYRDLVWRNVPEL